jgi:uncharacterized protein YabE (DUF348 family)
MRRPGSWLRGNNSLATESITAKRIAWTLPKWLSGLLAPLLIAGALALLVLGWQYTGSQVVVVIDGHRSELRTHATTVGDALHQAGLDLHREDWVSPDLEAPLEPGLVVEVRRAWPVKLHVDGRTRLLRTHALTVGDVLDEAGVQTGPADEIWLGEQLVDLDALLGGSFSDPRAVSSRGGPRLGPGAVSVDPPLVSLRRAVSLTLDDGGLTRTLHTTTETVGQVLQQYAVSLFLGDAVTPGLQERIEPGMTVAIQRSVPVKILVDGRVIPTRTRAETVAGVLGQEGVALVGLDRAVPDLTAPILPNMVIRVTRVREALAIEFDPIPFTTIWVADPELEIDHQRLVQDGQLGLTKHRYRVVYEDGAEVQRFLEDTWAEQPPITKTLAYGTRIVVRTLDTPDGPIEYWRKMRVYTTSYKPASCGKAKDDPRYGYTRLGWKLKKGIVAVDPSVIPLRTAMYVPGYGLARAGDIGGGVKGKFVDLGFSDNDYQSWHWWSDIYLLTPVPPSSQIRWVLPNWPKFPDRRR